MPGLQEFRLPDLGEGLTEGEILGWLVAEGEVVTLNQPIVEVETAKAAVEVPSPYAGTVIRLHHGAGETVDVGTTIITVDTGSPSGTGVPVPTAGPDDLVPVVPDSLSGAGLIGGAAPGGRTAVLVGYGPRSTTAARRPRRARPPAAGSPAPAPVTPVPAAPAPQASRSRALAKPPVRRLARDLGVDLGALTGSGDGGVVTRADVQAAASPAASPAAPPVVFQVGSPAGSPAVSAAAQGDRRIPVKGVRKLTAEHMVASAFTAPHVTEFLTCDVTATTELVARLRTLPDFADVKVTPLLLVARALLVACRRHPEVNASWDEAAQEIVVHGAVNLGIAAATPRGLLVPNVKDAGSLGLPALAEALSTLTATARDGRTSPADMAGGTVTITNVGVFGVDTGTPILNPGEAAILCLGAIRPTPWVVDGEIVVRQVTTLGLSFDHRMVDGQLGSRFLADIAAMLTDPAVLLAWS